jgi:hypothetical protein
MKHKRPHSLCQNTRGKRRNSTATTPRAPNKPNSRRLNMARQRAREDSLRARVNGAHEEAEDGDGDGVGDGVGDEPGEELEGGYADDKAGDEGAFAEAGGEVREGEAAEGDAGLVYISFLSSENFLDTRQCVIDVKG